MDHLAQNRDIHLSAMSLEVRVRDVWSSPGDYRRILTAHIHGKESAYTRTFNGVSWKMPVKWLEQITTKSFLGCSWVQGLSYAGGTKKPTTGVIWYI